MPQFDDSRIDAQLAKLKHSSTEEAMRLRAERENLPYLNLTGVTIDTDALRIIPEAQARAAEIAIFMERNKALSVAVTNPKNPQTAEALTTLTTDGYTLTTYLVSPQSLSHAWERYRDGRDATAEKKGVLDVDPNAIASLSKSIAAHDDIAEHIAKVSVANNAARITQIIEILFGGALALNASDIHIEPEQHGTRLRYRLDGVLFDIATITNDTYPLLASRFKLLSGLILNVHDHAQDGRFTFDVGTRTLEVRTSVIPGAYGESIVMRLLDPDASSFKLTNLGLNEKLHAVITEELKRPSGAILTTGPTGSGKTTALYAFMQEIHNSEVKIITIEDPVEYKLPGIVQTQTDDEYTFESGLRAILRQDPDVIMVGEIRDRDVAEVAMNAALTGHQVFSTLHTNSAAGAFPRLMDLGIDARTIGSAINIVLGQRLVRVLCEHCKVPRPATTEEQKIIARVMDAPVTAHTLYEAPGCPKCSQSGFRGRIGIFEAVRVDSAVEEIIARDPSERAVHSAARAQGIPSMQQDGIEKVITGITSLDELERVMDLHNTRLNEQVTESPESDSTDFASHVV